MIIVMILALSAYSIAPVFDRSAPSTVLAVAELSKKDVYDKLLKYAVWPTGSTDDAQGLLADAIECVGDPQSQTMGPGERKLLSP